MKYWTTFNEGNFYCIYFYDLFYRAGLAQHGDLDLRRCLRHFVLGHAKAYRTYRSKYAAKQGGQSLREPS